MTSHLFILKNAELDNKLAKKLRAWRRKGKSYRWIATELSKTGTPVQRTAVDTWLKKLGID